MKIVLDTNVFVSGIFFLPRNGDKDLLGVWTKAALILTPRQFCD
jgi:predicted nucleic acid-binding protein